LANHAVGPFATQILAGLGATVLKVERPPRGDHERTTEPPMFYACNQGKRSVAIDTGTPDGKDLLISLIRDCHVLVEGFRPGVTERMGVDYERVKAELQPKIIYVSLPGFGSSGPYATRRGYDTELRAIAGEIYINKDSNGEPRYAGASPAFDFACAMYAAMGVVTTLLDKDHGPVHLEASILASGLHWTFARLIPPRPEERGHRQHVFRAGDGKYLTVTNAEVTQFPAFCAAIGRPDLERDGKFAAIDEINKACAAAVATDTQSVWVERFEKAGVACAPILEPEEVFEDPQVQHLGVIGLEPQPWSRVPIFGLPTRPLGPPPAVDQDGDAVRAKGWDGIAADRS
jgi:formyl-CoA transferase